MLPTHQTQTGNIHATGVVTAAVEAAVQCSSQRLPTLGQAKRPTCSTKNVAVDQRFQTVQVALSGL